MATIQQTLNMLSLTEINLHHDESLYWIAVNIFFNCILTKQNVTILKIQAFTSW